MQEPERGYVKKSNFCNGLRSLGFAVAYSKPIFFILSCQIVLEPISPPLCDYAIIPPGFGITGVPACIRPWKFLLDIPGVAP
jgi:hypothetical protein